MGKVKLVQESEATGKVKALFEEIKETLKIPFVPELFRALANDPNRLETVWAQTQEIVSSGVLDIRTKLMVVLAVASAQKSDYFVTMYSAILKRLSGTDEEMTEIQELAKLASELNRLATDFKLKPEI